MLVVRFFIREDEDAPNTMAQEDRDMTYALTNLFVLLAGSATAAPTIANCSSGDSPGYGTSCNGFCTYSANVLKCDLRNLGTPFGTTDNEGVVVHDYNGHDIHAWGMLQTGITSQVLACCVIDDVASQDVETVELWGTSERDDLWFKHTSTYSLEPHSTGDLVAEIHGGPANDDIEGSEYDGSDYVEYLYGNQDVDTIQGNGGDDYLYGNAGSDTLQGGFGDDHLYGGLDGDTLNGNDGNDVIYGGDGDDELIGSNGDDILHGEDGDDTMLGGDNNDTICDSSKSSTGTCESDKLAGGDGDDILWYEWTNCGAAGNPDPLSSGEGNDDTCGDADAYPNGWGSPAFSSCENDISTAPAACN